MTNTLFSPYDWERDIAPHLDTLVPVQGGFTPAQRGIVTLQDKTRVFVKIATDLMTQKWLAKEVVVYQRLQEAGYTYMPELLAVNSDHTAMALTYLEGADFSDAWSGEKLEAVMQAREELQQHKQLFENDPLFRSDDIVSLDSRWPSLLIGKNINSLDRKLHTLGVPLNLDLRILQEMARIQEGWGLKEDTLIHEDIRGDNFGYDPVSKTGKLIDWNWLCIGDESLDITPLFVNMYINGFNPYAHHPEKYDAQMLRYLVSFWLDVILQSQEVMDERETNLRKAQARNIQACLELLQNKTA